MILNKKEENKIKIDSPWSYLRQCHKMFLVAQYLQIEELVQKKQVHQLQCEDTWVSSMQLTLFQSHKKEDLKWS